MAERRAQPWITYVLIAANVAMFGVELAAGASAITPTPQQMIDLGGNFAPLTLHGEWWRIVSSMFLHYGAIHIGMNMICLYQARVVEQLYGKLGYAAIYLVAGLLGGVASLARNTNAVSAGASGAVFGVFGAFGAFLVLRKAAMDEEVWRKTTRQILTFVGINLVYGMSVPGIDMSAHIGGLIGGFAVGALLLAGRSSEAQRTVRSVIATVAGIAITAGAVLSLKPPSDVGGMIKELDRIEKATLPVFQSIATRFDEGKVDHAVLATELERDVIGPWKQLDAKMSTVDRPPERIARLWNLLRNYSDSRLKSFDLFLKLLHATPEQRDAAMEAFNKQMDEVARDTDAITAESTRLSVPS
jgi:rhomboid protease GluP